MGTYDVWIRTQNHDWLKDKKKVKAFLEKHEYPISVFGITTNPITGEQFLAGRAHTNELEESLAEETGAITSIPEILWGTIENMGGISQDLGMQNRLNDRPRAHEYEEFTKELEEITEVWEPPSDFGWGTKKK